MAINIQNLIDAINTKVQALDSSSDITEINKLTRLANNINSSGGVLEYRSLGELPDADSGNIGKLVYTQDKKYDDNGTFYFGVADGWQKITLIADSDEANISFVVPYTLRGTQYGYVVGGTSASTITNIQQFSFTSEGNTTNNYATLSSARGYSSTSRSTEYGYVAGGFPNPPVGSNVIDKFPFAAGGASTDIGNLTVGVYYPSGASSEEYGYTGGGNAPSATNIYQKYSHVTDGDAANVGTLTVAKYLMGQGNSSSVAGYFTSGWPTTYVRHIEKFTFASDTSTALSGALTRSAYAPASQSSAEHGYNTGGDPNSNVIDKFPFAADGDATDVGDLTYTSSSGSSGSCSTTTGYHSGGNPNISTMNKFPFASDGNAVLYGGVLSTFVYGADGLQN